MAHLPLELFHLHQQDLDHVLLNSNPYLPIGLPGLQIHQLCHQILDHHLLFLPQYFHLLHLGPTMIDPFLQLGDVFVHPTKNGLNPLTMVTEIPLQVVSLEIASDFSNQREIQGNTFVSKAERQGRILEAMAILCWMVGGVWFKH